MREKKGFSAFIVVLVLVLVLGVFSFVRGFVRSQETGQVGVWTTPTHKFIKTTTKTGIGSYNPLNKVYYFNVRNNSIKFTEAEPGKKDDFVTSPVITINNKEGVRGDVEASVTYSIEPSKVESIWKEFGTQEAFEDKIVHQNIRGIIRDVYSKYTSLETYNSRSKIQEEIKKDLDSKLNPRGVLIEEVSLQNISYPKKVVDGFTTYQEKAIEIESAKAEKEKAIINADKKLEVAEKEAEANKISAKELSPEILTQQYIEMLGKKDSGNKVIITDGKSVPMINIDK